MNSPESTLPKLNILPQKQGKLPVRKLGATLLTAAVLTGCSPEGAIPYCKDRQVEVDGTTRVTATTNEQGDTLDLTLREDGRQIIIDFAWPEDDRVVFPNVATQVNTINIVNTTEENATTPTARVYSACNKEQSISSYNQYHSGGSGGVSGVYAFPIQPNTAGNGQKPANDDGSNYRGGGTGTGK